uniref:Uncharacterized protein n=1 Tax=Anguilla anguilla TaxID=7936 RepID=A0A0E9U714_ANGAN
MVNLLFAFDIQSIRMCSAAIPAECHLKATLDLNLQPLSHKPSSLPPFAISNHCLSLASWAHNMCV